MTGLLAYLPLLACGASIATIWKCFNVVESLSKQPFKQQIANSIATSSLFTVGTRLPEFCIIAFEAIFTDKLWSIRGFIRSCIASIVVVAILFAVWLSSIPDEWHLRISALAHAGVPNASTWFLIGIYGDVIDIDSHGHLHAAAISSPYTEAMSIHRLDIFGILPFLYNFVADFVALILTWRVLTKLSTRPNITILRLTITFLVFSCVLLVLSFFVLDAVVTFFNYVIGARSPGLMAATPQGGGIANVGDFVKATLLFPFYKRYPNEWAVGTLYGVFVWSSLMGVLWLGIFGTSLIIANVSMKSKALGRGLTGIFTYDASRSVYWRCW